MTGMSGSGEDDRPRKGFRAELNAGGVTIDSRDIEMLTVIDRAGSLHEAADTLGRSYARMQRRIVELEDAVGTFTVRRRGGAGGGGTELTETARELCRRFERHLVELEGLASVPDSVFTGRVIDRSGDLATVDTAVGVIAAIVRKDAEHVEITVRADAVVLSDPLADNDSDRTSLRNEFRGIVDHIDRDDAVALVTIVLGDDRPLRAIVTRESLDRLDLIPGDEIHASFKATAARGTSLDAESTVDSP